MIVGADSSRSDYVKKAILHNRSAYRPSTLAAQRMHISCLCHIHGHSTSVHNSNCFIFLRIFVFDSVSPRAIANYVSSLKTAAKRYKFDSDPMQHQLVSAYLRSISINSTFAPTPKVFLAWIL